jgi:plastocyanin
VPYPLRALTLTCLLLGSVLPLAGCSRESGGPGSATAADPREPAAGPVPNQVVIDNFAFSPARITVSVGTRVTWVNRDDVPHTATSTARPRAFDSGALDTDAEFTHVFSAPGTYEYFCAVHPNMVGQVIVK